MRIVFVSHTAAGGNFVVGSHHLARELARRGHDIWHVSTAKWLGKKRVRGDFRWRARVDADGVKHWTPDVPVPLRCCQNRLWLAGAARLLRVDQADIVLIDQPMMCGILDAFRGVPVIYRPTDIVEANVLRERQGQILERADGVIATSSAVLADLRVSPQLPQAVIANGVEFRRFAAASEVERRRGLVYVGSLCYRFDWEALREIARALPNEPVDIFGPIEGDVPPLPENVSLCGPLPYAELPRTLRRYRVGLLPLSDSPVNKGRSPMKFYEYSAAGLSILTREVPSLIENFQIKDRSHVFAYRASADIPSQAVAAYAHDEGPFSIGQIAAANDWSLKAAEVEEFVLGVVNGVSHSSFTQELQSPTGTPQDRELGR